MSKTHRIMIVEDEPNVRLVFLTALTSDEYVLTSAEDGETALRRLKQQPVDMVLLDLRMPVMGGMELLRRLREEGIGVPVVIVSAHGEVPNVVQAMRLGAIDFLPKPTTPESLRRVVAEVLARSANSAAPIPTRRATDPTAEALAKAKAALNRRAFGEAEQILDKLLGADPRCAEAHYLLGVLREMRGERHAAYADYRAALRADPGYEPARLHLMKYFDDRIM